MLKLSKRMEYGLMAIHSIAHSKDGELLNTKEIAARNGIPHDILAKILQNLVRSGIVASQQGAHGGYLLARSVEEMSISSVIEAVDGPMQLVACFGQNGDNVVKCNLVDSCSVRTPLSKIEHKIRQVFEHTTVSEVL
jgi:Rrf2 family protein